MDLKDARMRSIDEMMSGIKTIKYNSMEEFFLKRINDKRKLEMKKLIYQRVLMIIITFST